MKRDTDTTPLNVTGANSVLADTEFGSDRAPRRWFMHGMLPLIGGVVGISLLAVMLSFRQAHSTSRIDTIEHLERVLRQCQDASYPLTSSVISQIAAFSGTDIALLTESGAITLTTPPLANASSGFIFPTEPNQLDSHNIAGTRYDYVWAKMPMKRVEDISVIVAVLVPSDRRLAIMRRTIFPQIALALVSIAFVATIAMWLINRTVRRLDQMQTQIRRIAGGEFLVLVHPGPDDSFSRLADSINSMSRQLALAHSRIAETERSRVIHLMANGMAHQLRNTLTGASLLLQTYLRGQSRDAAEEVSMAIDQIGFAQESVRRLLASDSGSELVDKASVSIQTIHERLRDAVTMYADHRGVDLKISFNEDDRDQALPHGNDVVGALVNLVINGIEAVETRAAERGAVSCTLQRDAHEESGQVAWHWQIIDNGPGPPVELGESIIETFVTSKADGIGLGLPMAARVAIRTGGGLTWERIENNTVFHFRLLDCDRGEHG